MWGYGYRSIPRVGYWGTPVPPVSGYGFLGRGRGVWGRGRGRGRGRGLWCRGVNAIPPVWPTSVYSPYYADPYTRVW